MHLHFERTVNARSDCSILSLTWMGKVPDELPEDEGWKLNRTNYYQEGWLATGNIRGIVGVTFTTSHCKKNVDFPLRTNYNLRGHRSEVIMVKWNEPYQKLASCDSSGIIFVWIKYEGRWSIELINDRNTLVTHFSWSHDGRMALICYQDGFVLVGSVAGQRYWSSMLNLDATITCGIWTPDDQQVYFGTTSGQIIVMDVHGAMVSQVQLSSEVGIASMAWSCEKFKMEEGDDNDLGVTNASERKFVLAVSLQNGYIYLLKTFDDVSPIQVNTGLQGPISMEWSNSRELLAVAGATGDGNGIATPAEYNNFLKFYNDKGVLIYSTILPYTQAPITALTWGHNDKRLFLATGTQIHIAWISRRIATLQLLCRLKIYDSLRHETQLSALPLPPRIRNLIGNLFAQTIRCCVPEASALRDFVSKPPIGSVRLHCTMIRHDDDNNHVSSGTCYTLYLEYLGGLVPLLKGKRTSKIRPEFVIFDPQVEDFNLHLQWSPESKSSGSSSHSTSGGNLASDSSDSDKEEGCAGSPRMQRRKKKRNKSHSRAPVSERQSGQSSGDPEPEDLSYVDTLPEHVRLVEVTSNIWGTKFKIHGLVDSVPANLGQVTYKTSLLHLQPRQMTLIMTELRDDFPVVPDPNFNPNLFSEDEEDLNQLEERARMQRVSIDNSPPIAPMSPRGHRLTKTQIASNYLGADANGAAQTAGRNVPMLAKAESYDDETSHVELTSESIRSGQRNAQISQNSGFVGGHQFNRCGNYSGSGQRHAISPLYCEGAVPALQSPKNAVAPSDIIFDRPPAQTLLSYTTSDYSNTTNNVQQVKSSIIAEHKNSSIPLTLNLSDQQKSLFKRIEVTAQNDYNAHNIMRNTAAERRKEKARLSPNQVAVVTPALNAIEIPIEDQVTAGPSMITQPIAPPHHFCIADSMIRSCSVGYLDSVDAQMVPNEVALQMLRKDAPKRLILVNRKNKHRRNNRKQNQSDAGQTSQKKLKNCGKSKSLDSSDLLHCTESFRKGPKEEAILEIVPESKAKSKSDESSPTLTVDDNFNNNNNNNSCATGARRETLKLGFFSSKSPLMRRKKDADNAGTNYSDKNKNRGRSKQKNVPKVQNEQCTTRNGANNGAKPSISLHTHALATLENLLTRLREDDNKRTPPTSPRLPRSSPSSPAPSKKGKRPQSASPIRKHILSSPLLGKKNRKNKMQESSDDEITASGDEVFNGTNYKNLETFQKAQLRQKLKRGRTDSNGCNGQTNNHVIPQRREFVMHNKAPMWNENSQVYQLDFGGRVTQESAKNFQIEFRGKQVMQFGRIDGNAYTLDFQYPFSALQAFAVALANVTQRLK